MRKNLQQWVFSRARPAFLLGMAHDLIAAGLAYYGASVIRSADELANFTPYLLIWLALAFLVFLLFGLNLGNWRYTSTRDLLQIIKSAFLASSIYAIVLMAGSMVAQDALRFAGALFPVFVVALGAPRLIYRLFRENGLLALLPLKSPPPLNAYKVVIVYGVNDNAETFIRSVRNKSRGTIHVAGILDDKHKRYLEQVHGVQVLGGLSELSIILASLRKRAIKVDEIVVTDLDTDAEQLLRIAEMANLNGLKVTRLPRVGASVELGSDGFGAPAPIDLNDLLNRQEILPGNAAISWYIEGRVIMVTGSGGSIGSELTRQIAALKPSALILAENSEHQLFNINNELSASFPGLSMAPVLMDVRDRARVRQVFAEYKPDVVFHAAALKHVPMVEDNPLEAIKTNVFGSRNVAHAARDAGVRAMVMISTDKAVNPKSVMGATKRIAEILCQSLDTAASPTRFETVRFGNVLGSNGSVVPLFAEQIKMGGPVTVTHPGMTRYFMSIPEAVRLILRACEQASQSPETRGKILVLDMGKPVLIEDLARKMIVLSGKIPDHDIRIVYTGLRAGEKLREELFSESENATRSSDGHFLLAAARLPENRLFERSLAELEAACADENLDKAMAVIRHLVPEYSTAAELPEKRPSMDALPAGKPALPKH